MLLWGKVGLWELLLALLGGFGPTCDHSGNCLKGLKAPRAQGNASPGMGELWHRRGCVLGALV